MVVIFFWQPELTSRQGVAASRGLAGTSIWEVAVEEVLAPSSEIIREVEVVVK